jgi:hypothetical protein
VVSAVYDDAAIGAAEDDAFASTGDSYEADFAQLAAALSGVGPATATTVESSGGLPGGPSGDSGGEPPPSESSGGGFPIGTILFVALIGGIWWILRRNKRRRTEMVENRIETARAEIREQMSVIANEILEFSDRIDQDQHPEAVAHYRRASEVFKDAEERMEKARTEAELESLSDELDDARWEMAAADAIVEGRPVPPKPEAEKPEPCFFDPTHGAGLEEATLQTKAGTRTVMVCRADAEKLRRGERVEPRSIDVGGRTLPAPQAPRTHGGRGMDWLDAFSIIVGGMAGRGMDYRWGRPRRGGLGGMTRHTSGGGGLGIPLPRRTGGSRSGSGSRSRSTPRSSRPSRSIGRGRGSR